MSDFSLQATLANVLSSVGQAGDAVSKTLGAVTGSAPKLVATAQQGANAVSGAAGQLQGTSNQVANEVLRGIQANDRVANYTGEQAKLEAAYKQEQIQKQYDMDQRLSQTREQVLNDTTTAIARGRQLDEMRAKATAEMKEATDKPWYDFSAISQFNRARATMQITQEALSQNQQAITNTANQLNVLQSTATAKVNAMTAKQRNVAVQREFVASQLTGAAADANAAKGNVELLAQKMGAEAHVVSAAVSAMNAQVGAAKLPIDIAQGILQLHLTQAELASKTSALKTDEEKAKYYDQLSEWGKVTGQFNLSPVQLRDDMAKLPQDVQAAVFVGMRNLSNPETINDMKSVFLRAGTDSNAARQAAAVANLWSTNKRAQLTAQANATSDLMLKQDLLKQASNVPVSPTSDTELAEAADMWKEQKVKAENHDAGESFDTGYLELRDPTFLGVDSSQKVTLTDQVKGGFLHGVKDPMFLDSVGTDFAIRGSGARTQLSSIMNAVVERGVQNAQTGGKAWDDVRLMQVASDLRSLFKYQLSSSNASQFNPLKLTKLTIANVDTGSTTGFMNSSVLASVDLDNPMSLYALLKSKTAALIKNQAAAKSQQGATLSAGGINTMR